MMPGRSLSGKTIGRSAHRSRARSRFARTCHSRPSTGRVEPLRHRDLAVVVQPERGRAGQDPRLRVACRLRGRAPRSTPSPGRPSSRTSGIEPERSAELASVVDQEHARAGGPAATAAASPAGPPPDHQHIDSACSACRSATCRRGDPAAPPPQRTGHADPRRSSTVVARSIGSDRRPGAPPGRARSAPRARPRTRRAAGRGRCCAPTTSTPLASSADASVSPANPVARRRRTRSASGFERSIAAAAREAARRRSREGVMSGEALPAGTDALTSFVSVSRTTLNQRRQPAVCTQRSANAPFGLSRMNRYSAHAASSASRRVRRVRDTRPGRRSGTRSRRAGRTTGRG